MSTQPLLGRGLDGGSSAEPAYYFDAGPSAGDNGIADAEQEGKDVLLDVFADRHPWEALILPKLTDGEDSLVGGSPRCAVAVFGMHSMK